MAKRSHRERAAGFTLIEVMVGIVLAALLIMGLTSLWALVGEEFSRLTLRQKAVFALNGEMERLVAVYRVETPLTQSVIYASPSPAPTGRFIYNNTYAAQPTGGAILDTDNNFQVREVFYFSAGGTGDRNLVWLDRAKGVVGNVSWTAPNLTDPNVVGIPAVDSPVAAAATCQDVSCVLLTLYIEFPYRFDLATRALQAMTPVRTISLKTIAGRKGP